MTETHLNAFAYVIGALTPQEQQDFERHLVECSQCADEVADARSVALALSTAVAVEPPAHLRTSLLATIAHTSQDEIATVTALTPDASTPAVSAPANDSNVVPMRPSRRHWATSLVAAAAVVAAVGFGGWAVQLGQEVREARQAADIAASQQAQLVKTQAKLATLLSADDIRKVSGKFISNGHRGSVVMSAKSQTAIFVTSGLPKLPEGKVYEAWTIKGVPVPAGTFSSDGSAAIVELTDAAFDADSIAVTIEPEGGSPKPTGDAVFDVNLPQA